jgi:release factor glutamine methyltransferase
MKTISKNKPLPLFEQQLILAHILKKSREYVLAHPEIELTQAQKRLFERLINRRKKHEPLAYILGRKEFYGLDFELTKHTLIPRPETELLVEEIINSKPKNKTIIDIGTGSGNIIITLAENIKDQNNYFAIDVSKKALAIAKLNAKKHKVDKKIKFIESDLLKNKKMLGHLAMKQCNDAIIIANLPYLSKHIYSSAMPDVKNFEPKSALLSGEEGLDHYKKLFSQIKKLETKNRRLKTILEISPEQKTKITPIIKKVFPRANIFFKKDLAGKWRMVSFEI